LIKANNKRKQYQLNIVFRVVSESPMVFHLNGSITEQNQAVNPYCSRHQNIGVEWNERDKVPPLVHVSFLTLRMNIGAVVQEEVVVHRMQNIHHPRSN
jgi:hypothetical protein